MKRLILLFALFAACCADAAISVQDDTGTTVTLTQPARRIVSLAPHATELLFAAGAGDSIVGTVSCSDYPAAAKSIPRVGDNRQVDIERLIATKPDLLVVWRHNASLRQTEQLRALGIPMFYSEPHKLDDIPETLQKLGRLAGTEERAQRSVDELRRTLFDLQETTARIRAVTHHLKGVKIAIMGCIVNGPGEMADADFGYVGSGVGKITLYRGKEVVKRGLNSDVAVNELINLIRENGMWVEKN